MPASGASWTWLTTAAARKQDWPEESCTSSRTKVSRVRGDLVRMKNLFWRRSSP